MRAKGRSKSRTVGLYSTICFHLVVLIILLIFSIHTVASQESSFVLDFTKQEELERMEKEMEFKEEISKELDDMLSATRTGLRNTAVDGSKLRDDRFRNPSEVYDEAKALQRRLDASRRDAMAQQAELDAVDISRNDSDSDSKEEHVYAGPAVISFDLEGRNANYLPVPAYKGYGSGDVLVQITVNQKGRVTAAHVVMVSSTSDTSLHEFALEAARRSRFSSSSSAPRSQTGSILYRFVAQ